MTEDFSEGAIQLIRGDRLEPSIEIPDVADFDHKDPPFKATFWNTSDPQSLRLLHESPLMWINGVTFMMWCIDLLHTWHLGPLGAYIGFVIWFILSSKVCAGCAFVDTEDGYKIGMVEIRSHLWRYYKEKRKGSKDFKKRGSAVQTCITP